MRVPLLLLVAYIVPIAFFGPQGDEPERENIWTRRYNKTVRIEPRAVPEIRSANSQMVAARHTAAKAELLEMEQLWEFAPKKEEPKKGFRAWLPSFAEDFVKPASAARITDARNSASNAAQESFDTAKDESSRMLDDVVTTTKDFAQTTSREIDHQIEQTGIPRETLLKYLWIGLKLLI